MTKRPSGLAIDSNYYILPDLLELEKVSGVSETRSLPPSASMRVSLMPIVLSPYAIVKLLYAAISYNLDINAFINIEPPSIRPGIVSATTFNPASIVRDLLVRLLNL